MKNSFVKKVLVLTLALTLTAGSALTVCASTDSPSQKTEESSSKHSSSSSSSSSASSVAASSSVKVGGVNITTTAAGAYAATKVAGVAVSTPAAELAASLGLTGSQKAFVTVYDTDAAKSPLAMDSLNAAASAIGATAGPVLSINLGYKEAGKFNPATGTANFTVGIPATFAGGEAYQVVYVGPGGVVEVLPDLDGNPATVTFAAKGGAGCYMLVK